MGYAANSRLSQYAEKSIARHGHKTLRGVMREIFGVSAAFSLVMLQACTPIPIYQAPAPGPDTAQLKLSFTDESLISGVVIVGKVDGEIICGQALPNYRKMIVISKGNPLISNLNASGVSIPAGKKITVIATGMNDGISGCGSPFISFTPNPSSSYEINVTNRSAGNYQPRATCPVTITERAASTNIAKSVAVTYEQCRSNK